MNDYKLGLTVDVGIADEKKVYQTVVFTGDMDKLGLDMVKEKLESLVNDCSCHYLVFDFSELGYINSDSIGFLMSLHAHLVKIGKMLVIVHAKANVYDILDAIGVLSIFEYYASFDDFKKKIA